MGNFPSRLKGLGVMDQPIERQEVAYLSVLFFERREEGEDNTK
jgi:hypothetical protein